MSSSTDVSIVVPVFNTPHYLVESCIASAASQEFGGSYEIVLVDDGSYGELAHKYRGVASSMGAKLIRHAENRGLAAARNTGIRSARGDVVILLDSDDLLEAGAAAGMHRRLVSSGALFAYSDHRKVTLEGETVHVRQKRTFQRLVEEFWGTPWNPFLHSTFIIHCQAFRREAFLDLGFFDTTFRYGEEIEFYTRLIKASPDSVPVAHVAENLYTYRVNPESICHQVSAYDLLIRNIEQILRTALREAGVDVAATARAGRCPRTDAALYVHRTGADELLLPPWLDHERLQVRDEWILA